MTPYRLPKPIQLQRLCNINLDYSTVMAHCRGAVGALFTKIALVVANLLRYSGMGNDPPQQGFPGGCSDHQPGANIYDMGSSHTKKVFFDNARDQYRGLLAVKSTQLARLVSKENHASGGLG
jgi:hypothetical protein